MLHTLLGKHFQPKAEYACGKYESNVDYWTKKSLFQETGVPSAEDCQKRCRKEKTCGAWTWGAVRHVHGLSDVCFLKVLHDGEKVLKKKNTGVVSGLREDLPCEMSEDER